MVYSLLCRHRAAELLAKAGALSEAVEAAAGPAGVPGAIATLLLAAAMATPAC